MTDSSALIENSPAISSDLSYTLKPSAVRSRSYRASILPTNKSSFNPTDTCILYIPGGRRGTYLDNDQSYLRMTITGDPTNTLNLDNYGGCVIQRMDIFHGSNLLETIQSYNVLTNYILDMQSSISQRVGLSANYGFDTTGTRKGATIVATNALTVCIPIFSGTIGVLADKCLPIGLLADDIRIEITFDTALNAVAMTTAAGVFSVTDIQLELTIIELSDEGESLVRSVADPNRPIFLHGSSWRHYTSTLASGTVGGYSTLIPARFASLKQLACLPRRTTEVSNVLAYSIGSRANPNIDYYWWRIGSSIIPSKAVYVENSANTAGFAESFTELLKAWHALHTVTNTTAIGGFYNVGDIALAKTPVTAINTGATSYLNGFAIAQELETFSQRNDVMLAGMNTLQSQVFFECNIGNAAAAGPATAYNMDFFAWYDHIIVLENGLLSVKF